MINIQINEQPFINAKDQMVNLACKARNAGLEGAAFVKDTAKKVSAYLGDNMGVGLSDIAYFSSIGGAIATYTSGTFFSNSSVALNALAYICLKNAAAQNIENMTSEERKTFDVATINFAINAGTEMLGLPGELKLAGVAFNVLSDHVKITRS